MTTTIAAEGKVMQYQVEHSPGLATSSVTRAASFSMVCGLLSDRPLERAVRFPSLRELTLHDWKQLAETHRPPQEWFEGEAESPF